ncbi:hypothetical protein WMY93_009719 [Mugilogobius chulae]|uniref:BESS domain-containing protein n=1 Tax=Mugilogobius chulae TaxID=88201 RepID=A0AAW0PFD0_9GOBI
MLQEPQRPYVPDDEKDESYHFALSIVPMLHRLDNERRQEAKINIINMLHNFNSSTQPQPLPPASAPFEAYTAPPGEPFDKKRCKCLLFLVFPGVQVLWVLSVLLSAWNKGSVRTSQKRGLPPAPAPSRPASETLEDYKVRVKKLEEIIKRKPWRTK